MDTKELEKYIETLEKQDKARVKAESDLRKTQDKLIDALRKTGDEKKIRQAQKIKAGMLPGQLIRFLKDALEA